MGTIVAALPAFLSAIGLAIVTFVAKKVLDFMRDFKAQHEALCESQRNQLKESIVAAYEKAMATNEITHMELDCFNRNFDSYKALGGNHYIHTIVKQLNDAISAGIVKVVGMSIPA